jgi:hypothetical protein
MNKQERQQLKALVGRLRTASREAPGKAVYKAGGTRASVAAQINAIANELEAMTDDEQPATTNAAG